MTRARGRGISPIGGAEENRRAVEDAGPYKGLGESAPVFGGASMRAARDAGSYGSESGAVSKFENISKRTDTSTSRAGATRGGITNNIKNHEASRKPPLRSNGAAHYRAERGSGSDKRIVSDSLYDDVQHLGFRGVRGDRFLTYPNRAGSLETCGFKQRFWSLLGLRPKATRARGARNSPRRRERSERRQWRMQGGERVAAVKISSVRRQAAQKFWAPQQCTFYK